MNAQKKIKLGGIIIARLDSKRFPGKVLKEINGIPLIEFIIRRANKIKAFDALVLATTDRPLDDPLVYFFEKKGIKVYRGNGDTNDVVHRVLICAKELSLDYFLRINGDSPFLDNNLVSYSSQYCYTGEYDLISNIPGRLFPYGISVEWIRTEALYSTYHLFKTAEEKEHLTKVFYNNPDCFKIFIIKPKNASLKNARLVVDTPTDYKRICTLMAELGDNKFKAGYELVAQCYLRLWPE